VFLVKFTADVAHIFFSPVVITFGNFRTFFGVPKIVKLRALIFFLRPGFFRIQRSMFSEDFQQVTKREIVLEENLPSAINPPKGCPFCTRCPRRIGDICDNDPPPEQVVVDRHVIKCHIPIEELSKVEPVIHVPDASERLQKPVAVGQ